MWIIYPRNERLTQECVPLKLVITALWNRDTIVDSAGVSNNKFALNWVVEVYIGYENNNVELVSMQWGYSVRYVMPTAPFIIPFVLEQSVVSNAHSPKCTGLLLSPMAAKSKAMNNEWTCLCALRQCMETRFTAIFSNYHLEGRANWTLTQAFVIP